jgi:hypothetical protein
MSNSRNRAGIVEECPAWQHLARFLEAKERNWSQAGSTYYNKSGGDDLGDSS